MLRKNKTIKIINMKRTITKTATLLTLVLSLFIISCEKDSDEIFITVFAKLSSYDDFEASYVSVDGISVDGEYVPWDFDLFSNIGIGETREIPVSVSSSKDQVTVKVFSSGSGSGISKTASVSGVRNGDKLDLDLGSGKFTIIGGNGDGVSGNWVRSDGASYLKFSGSTVYLCNGSSGQEFSGTYDADAGEATLVEGSTTLTFYITPEGSDKILIEQYVSGNHVGSQYYYSTSEYPCN